MTRQLNALRAGPRPLPYKQVVALAGQVYRARVAKDEANPELGPGLYEKRVQSQMDRIADLRRGRVPDEDDILCTLDPAEAYVIAHAEGGRGEFCGDPVLQLEPDYIDRKLEEIYGAEADDALAAHALVVDGETRAHLLREVSRAEEDAARATIKGMRGDFSPDAAAAARFPAFVPPEPAPADAARRSLPDRVDVTTLFERWVATKRERKAASTLRRYAPSLASLAAFTGKRDYPRDHRRGYLGLG